MLLMSHSFSIYIFTLTNPYKHITYNQEENYCNKNDVKKPYPDEPLYGRIKFTIINVLAIDLPYSLVHQIIIIFAPGKPYAIPCHKNMKAKNDEAQFV